MADPFNDDTDYDFSSLPGGYKEPYLATTKKQAESETNAMELLRQSMQRSAEITPTQGLASALLAAVPTLGGYMIGKSVGTADVSGLGINSFDEYKKLAGGTGAYAGGLAGVDIGNKSSDSFLKGLDEQQAARADVLQKQAALEAQNAARSQSEGASLLQAGLNRKATGEENEKNRQNQLQLERERNRRLDNSGLDAPLSPELQQEYAKEFGVPAESLRSMRDVQTRVDLKRIKDTNQRQKDQFGHQADMAQLPDVEIIPGMTPTLKNSAQAGKILENHGEMKQIVVPRLRDVFTRPDATISEKESAVGATIIALKTMKGMGASFTTLEEKLIKAGLPSFATISPSQFFNFLQAEAQGQDPLQMISTLEREVDLGAANGLRFNKYQFPQPKEGLGAGAPAPTGGTPPPGFNPQDPGFLAWKASQGRK